jgi:DNA-binding NtrC family response regulator
MQSDSATDLQPQRLVNLRTLQVRVIEGPDTGQCCQADRHEPLTIGSSDDNQLTLSDPLVSRYHLELQRGASGVQLTDLGSRNGSFVGATRLVQAIVAPGTAISLGNSVLRVEDGELASRPPSNDLEVQRAEISGLVWKSPAMDKVVSLVKRIATGDVAALIEGETGTGKEVVARAIHEQSARRGRPYVVVDCGSLPTTLIASELFGHERGAFTGADRTYTGAFERADGGTIFLDEIGELPLDVQPVLLGVLERRKFRRLAGSKSISVDVRVLAATNRDLRAEVNAGSFRADLYYRLAVARIVIPPLRERVEDIDALVAHFVRESNGATEPLPFGDGALAKLRAHRWSGNVRELRNVVEAALMLGELNLESSALSRAEHAPQQRPQRPIIRYREARTRALSDFESRYLTQLIEACDGNASKAARIAQMDRPYLLTLLRKHGLR